MNQSAITLRKVYSDLSCAELRLELDELNSQRLRSIVAICRKRTRVAAVTAELVDRGAF
jgi:hypothetical protein